MERLVTAACERIQSKLRCLRQQNELTKGEKQTRWAEAWLKVREDRPAAKPSSVALYRWTQRWEASQPYWGLLGVGPPDYKTTWLHWGLRKAESSALIQIRTGRIGLAAFLNKARVPGYPSPFCQCGQAPETASHIIAHCPRFTEARSQLRDPQTSLVDSKALVSRTDTVRRLMR